MIGKGPRGPGRPLRVANLATHLPRKPLKNIEPVPDRHYKNPGAYGFRWSLLILSSLARKPASGSLKTPEMTEEKTMSNETTQLGKKGEWQKLIRPLEGNPDLAYLATQREKLSGLLDQAVEITHQQNALAARKQELSKQLQTIMLEGQRTATILRKSIAAHYGVRSEKLAEFGMQPFRGRPFAPRTKKPKPQPEAPDNSGAQTSTPAS